LWQVVVGKPLYEIDAVGEGSASSTAPSVPVSTPAASSGSTSSHDSASHGHKRQPRIKFIGKRSREKKATEHVSPVVVASPSSPSKPVVAKTVKNHHPSSKDFFEVKDKAWHGRPKLSAKEILAIESGGAM
jgi:hypothetical protein